MGDPDLLGSIWASDTDPSHPSLCRAQAWPQGGTKNSGRSS